MSDKMMLKTTPASIANSVWGIEEIVEGPKYETVNGKKKKFYKVKWSQSFELATNIPSELIDIFEKRGKKEIKILGPVVEPSKDFKADDYVENNSTNGYNSSSSRQMKMQRLKFAVEIGEDISVLSYKQVKTLYKDELFNYFEERAQIDHV
uniref:Uncharacterized protein n=1 Tax=Ditylenchus dipsaci TaxID=166011 RepID=A0A915D1Z6_9BILA